MNLSESEKNYKEEKRKLMNNLSVRRKELNLKIENNEINEKELSELDEELCRDETILLLSDDYLE